MNHYALYNASMLIDLDGSTKCGSCNDKERNICIYIFSIYLLNIIYFYVLSGMLKKSVWREKVLD